LCVVNWLILFEWCYVFLWKIIFHMCLILINPSSIFSTQNGSVESSRAIDIDCGFASFYCWYVFVCLWWYIYRVIGPYVLWRYGDLHDALWDHYCPHEEGLILTWIAKLIEFWVTFVTQIPKLYFNKKKTVLDYDVSYEKTIFY